MTGKELRNKIAKHVCCACEMGLGDGECAEGSDYRICGVCGDVADALIATGIGDVKESENKATAAEIVAQAAASTAIEKIEEWKHRAEVYKRALHIAHTAGEFAYYVDKAEKELAEERKDEQS